MKCILDNPKFDMEICSVCSQGTQACLTELQAENTKMREEIRDLQQTLSTTEEV